MQHIYMKLGQLLERSEHQGRDLKEIKTSLRTFDRRLMTIESRRSFRMPPLEKYLKDLITILVPAYTLWATGSVQKMIEAMQLAGGR